MEKELINIPSKNIVNEMDTIVTNIALTMQYLDSKFCNLGYSVEDIDFLKSILGQLRFRLNKETSDE